MSDLAAVLAQVRHRVVPDPEERSALETTVEELLDRARDAAGDLPVDAEVLHVGSTARDTWLAGDHDVDLFVRLPTDCDREELAIYGRRVGEHVLTDPREEYAEHPYVTGHFDGVDVDVVPCYAVDSAADIRSSVDRTPFHSAYLADRIDGETADEIRLFKALCAGIGVYGSDLRTRGVSGYLAELLVLEYGDFTATVDAIRDWQPPVTIDPADHQARSFEDPLVVVDPTDPERNVAAVVSESSVARLIHYARSLRDSPDVGIITPDEPDPLSPSDLAAHIERRGTVPVALRFPAPELVEDELYPQLRRSLRGVRGELDRRGFGPIRSTVMADETAVLFIECETATRPAIERHEGPPVFVDEHAESFLETYADEEETYGPFVDGDRYVVERPRDVTTLAEFFESDRLFDVSLGRDVKRVLQDDRTLLVGDDVEALLPEFGVELAGYFSPRP
jgi:tRNA nucleotidyltransferase (CCA-adding enzyme)